MNLRGFGPLKNWFVVITGAMFYSYQFVVRVSPSPMKDDIMSDFLIDAATFGMITGAFYIGYSWIQIPLGLMMDRLGPRRFMAAAGALCGSGCILFVSTRNPYFAAAARIMMGLGAANGFLGTLKLGMMWVPPRHFAKVIAVAMIFGTIGAVLGNAPLSILVDAVGWHNAMYVLGGLGFVQGGIILLFVKDKPSPKTVYQSPLVGLKQVMANPQAWIVSVVGLCMYVPIITLGDAWGKPFLMRAYGLEETEALTIVTTMFLGMAAGGPVFAGLSDMLLRRRFPLIIGSIGALTVQSLIVFGHNVPLFWMYPLFFLVGFFYTSKGLCFAIMSEVLTNREAGGVAIGFTNTIVNLSGLIFHPLIGYLLVKHWAGTSLDGSPFYTESDYRFGLCVIPICTAIALASICLLKETHPGRTVDPRFD